MGFIIGGEELDVDGAGRRPRLDVVAIGAPTFSEFIDGPHGFVRFACRLSRPVTPFEIEVADPDKGEFAGLEFDGDRLIVTATPKEMDKGMRALLRVVQKVEDLGRNVEIRRRREYNQVLEYVEKWNSQLSA